MVRTFRFGVLSLLVAFLLLGGLGAWLWITLPDPSVLARQYPVVRSQGTGKQPRIRISPRRPSGWVGLSGVSGLARAAILISEDGKFYSHMGVDLEELKNAVKKDLMHLEFKRGASTITQQLVKNVFLTRSKTLFRKFQELILTVRIERALSKERIFELYLNVIEFGPDLYGIGPASMHYFQKPPSDLGAKEGAFLAMLLPSPVKYSSSFRDKALSEYGGKIIRMLLRKMVVLGYLTREEADAEWETPLSFEELPEHEEPSLEDPEPEEDSEEDEGGELTEADETSGGES